MAKEKESVFARLNEINVNGHTETKSVSGTKLTYLSWAWAEVKKLYPEASYTIYRDEQNRPYVDDPDFGLMCYTTVTIEGQTHDMWLPVMDGSNRAMKRHPYSIKTKYGEQQVAAATMFDINKTIMRCLVKNLAMFGLGLYIYAGEDLPETDNAPAAQPSAKDVQPQPTASAPQFAPQSNTQDTPADIIRTTIAPAVAKATTMAELLQIYNQYPTLNGTLEFKNLFSTRRKQLEAVA